METLNGRPCKACVSVEDMMRMSREAARKKKAQGQAAGGEAAKPPVASSSSDQKPTSSTNVGAGKRRADCPVDKDELGRSTWNLLHTMAAYYPEQPTGDERQTMKQTVESLSKVSTFGSFLYFVLVFRPTRARTVLRTSARTSASTRSS